MLGRFPTIYHFHIPKCGGTSIGWWLARHVNDRRLFDPIPFADVEENFGPSPDPAAREAEERELAPQRRQEFYAAEVVSTHAPLRHAMRDAMFRFTVLRDPAARVASLVADWRRLAAHDLARVPPHAAAVISRAGRMSLEALLRTYGARLDILDNYMTRTLAALSLPLAARRARTLEELAAVAIDNLERLDFVGLAERPQATLARLAERLGLAPEFEPPRLNATSSAQALATEAAEAETILAEITAFDRRVYEYARALFERRDASAGEAYDRAAFERLYAAQAARQLRGSAEGRDVVFSVRDPILGFGLHGRDGAGLDSCCVWSGPSRRFVLYMPVPAGARLEIRLWVRGYAGNEQRSALRVAVDGEPSAHRFEAAPGYAETVVVESRARRSFVALEIDVGETATTGERGRPTFDARRRGLAFDRYGWRALPD